MGFDQGLPSLGIGLLKGLDECVRVHIGHKTIPEVILLQGMETPNVLEDQACILGHFKAQLILDVLLQILWKFVLIVLIVFAFEGVKAILPLHLLPNDLLGNEGIV